MCFTICGLGSHYTLYSVVRDYVKVPFWLIVHCLPAWIDATECRAGVCAVWPMDTGLILSAGDDKHVGAKRLN